MFSLPARATADSHHSHPIPGLFGRHGPTRCHPRCRQLAGAGAGAGVAEWRQEPRIGGPVSAVSRTIWRPLMGVWGLEPLGDDAARAASSVRLATVTCQRRSSVDGRQLSTVRSRPSFVVNCKTFVMLHPLSAVCDQPSTVIRLQPSFIHRLPSFARRPSCVFRHISPVLRHHQTPVVCLLPSAVYHQPSSPSVGGQPPHVSRPPVRSTPD